ncbi:GNAT family N-acetyltransferase [Stappia sp.]|uniref:GNAT family N-acetyltransferase n=1 Tax=Stappia sp. TaxID=1870903 RepID=UPI003D0CD5C9
MAPDVSMLTCSTARLVLRPFRLEDFDAYSFYHQREDVYRFLYSAPPEAEALRAGFEAAMQTGLARAGDTLRLAVERADDGAVIGEVLLKLADGAAMQAEIGYIFNPRYGGSGYATEAVEAMIGIGFRAFGFHRIFARIDTLNHGSVGIVERLGLRREAHFIENDRFDGVWGDEFVYATLAREWQASRA